MELEPSMVDALYWRMKRRGKSIKAWSGQYRINRSTLSGWFKHRRSSKPVRIEQVEVLEIIAANLEPSFPESAELVLQLRKDAERFESVLAKVEGAMSLESSMSPQMYDCVKYLLHHAEDFAPDFNHRVEIRRHILMDDDIPRQWAYRDDYVAALLAAANRFGDHANTYVERSLLLTALPAACYRNSKFTEQAVLNGVVDVLKTHTKTPGVRSWVLQALRKHNEIHGCVVTPAIVEELFKDVQRTHDDLYAFDTIVLAQIMGLGAARDVPCNPDLQNAMVELTHITEPESAAQEWQTIEDCIRDPDQRTFYLAESDFIYGQPVPLSTVEEILASLKLWVRILGRAAGDAVSSGQDRNTVHDVYQEIYKSQLNLPPTEMSEVMAFVDAQEGVWREYFRHQFR